MGTRGPLSTDLETRHPQPFLPQVGLAKALDSNGARRPEAPAAPSSNFGVVRRRRFRAPCSADFALVTLKTIPFLISRSLVISPTHPRHRDGGFQVMADYAPTYATALAARRGDTLQVLSKDNADWWRVRHLRRAALLR